MENNSIYNKIVRYMNTMLHIPELYISDISLNKALNLQGYSITKHNLVEFKHYLQSLTKFLCKHLDIHVLPTCTLKHNDITNSKNILSATGYYDPDEYNIVLYTHNRHPKDILRSYAHEMIHHKQNLEGRLIRPTTQNYLWEESEMYDIENEAYSLGNMCFRLWEDNIKYNK